MADRVNEQIRALLRDAGVSANTVSGRVGRSQVLRSFDRAHDRIPESDLIRRVAEVLEVDVSQVLSAALEYAGLPSTGPDYDRQQHRAARLVGEYEAERREEVVDLIEKVLEVQEFRRIDRSK